MENTRMDYHGKAGCLVRPVTYFVKVSLSVTIPITVHLDIFTLLKFHLGKNIFMHLAVDSMSPMMVFFLQPHTFCVR